MQGRWDLEGKNLRWYHIPIIEAWEIVGWPKARDVLGLKAASRRTSEQLSVGLKPLNDDDETDWPP